MIGNAMRGGALLVVLLVALGAAVAFSWQGRRASEPRTLTLVARDMAFHVEGETATNPVLAARAGERLRLVVRNEDPGMKHDLVIPALELRTRALDNGESDALTLTLPSRPGRLDYLCSFHAVVMRGALAVSP